jgi:hypothetical protein
MLNYFGIALVLGYRSHSQSCIGAVEQKDFSFLLSVDLFGMLTLGYLSIISCHQIYYRLWRWSREWREEPKEKIGRSFFLFEVGKLTGNSRNIGRNIYPPWRSSLERFMITIRIARMISPLSYSRMKGKRGWGAGWRRRWRSCKSVSEEG